jgi:hypothetical protein
VYVQRGEELISIAAGENIGPDYRVDSITEESIRFTYLPMKERQVLARAEPEGEKPGSESARPEKAKPVLERAEPPGGKPGFDSDEPAGGRPD